MTIASRFSKVITSEEQLREIVGYPTRTTAQKAITELDDYCREFIAKSPFLLIATSDAQGNMDVSPKGDPPGFVHVLDDSTLLIPDRPGNRRADTFSNILQNPKIGLLFMIPGNRTTLRMSGEAALIRDADLREQMAVQGKIPELLVAVNVQEAFVHCTKCIIRSGLWNADDVIQDDGLVSLAQAIIQHAQIDQSVEALRTELEDDTRTNLY